MGVKGLWKLIEGAEETVSLESLKGFVLALDASGWVVHLGLRSFFFRVRNLLNAGIVPVVVLDGRVPKAKQATVAERRWKALHYKGGRQSAAMKRKMREEPCVVRPTTELIQVLRGMGAPVLRSEGEAEKLCAWLDQRGIVDGVISGDNDALLYGAKTVYRHMSTIRGGVCKRIRSRDILSWCGLSRWMLIGVGALKGCDLHPSGVQGIGLTKALDLVLQADLRSKRDLRKFLAPFFRGATLSLLGELLDEYLKPPELWDFVHTEMLEPDIYTFVDVANRKFGWSSKQSLEALAPVLIRWHLEDGDVPGVEIFPVSTTGSVECQEVPQDGAKRNQEDKDSGVFSPKIEEMEMEEKDERRVKEKEEKEMIRSREEKEGRKKEEEERKLDGTIADDNEVKQDQREERVSMNGGIAEVANMEEGEYEKVVEKKEERQTTKENVEASAEERENKEAMKLDKREEEKSDNNAQVSNELPACLKVLWSLQSHGIEVRVKTLEDLEDIRMAYEVRKLDT